MYAGEIVEQTDVHDALRASPSTRTRAASSASIPVPGEIRDELAAIPGIVPNLIELPAGCRFAPRCLARVEEHGYVLADRGPPRAAAVGRRTTSSAAGSTTTRTGTPTAATPTPGRRPAHDRRQLTAAGATTVATRWSARGPQVKHFPHQGRRAAAHRRPRCRPSTASSFDIRRGETLGLVGESGCGKTTVGRLLLRLIDPTGGHDPLRRPGHHRAQRQGPAPYRRRMQIIFQDPYASLNPRQLGRRQHRRGPAHPRAGHHRGAAHEGRRPAGPGRPAAVPRPTATRTSSPAASASASASPARWPSSPTSSSATSRSRPSTCRSRRRSSTCSSRCRASSG